MEEFVANLRVLSHITSDYKRILLSFKSLNDKLNDKSDFTLGYYNDGKNNINLGSVAYKVFVDSLILQYNRFDEIYCQIIKDINVEDDIKLRYRKVKSKDKLLYKSISDKFPDIRNYRNNISVHIYKKNSSSLLSDGVRTEFIIPTNISDLEFILDIILTLVQNIFEEFKELIIKVNNHKIINNINFK